MVEEKRIAASTVYLRVSVKGPDARCHFSYGEDGRDFQPIGEDFYAQPDNWMGAKRLCRF
jgi:hypothetical protein